MAARGALKHGRVAIYYKEYATAAERGEAEAEAQAILANAAEGPITEANIAAGSFSFELEADSEGRRIVLRASGNERMLERVGRLAAENGWQRRTVRIPALRTEAGLVATEAGTFVLSARTSAPHPESINAVSAPLRAGQLVSANVPAVGTLAAQIAAAEASARNVVKMTRRARRSSLARGKVRDDVWSAAYGAASLALHANASSAAAAAGGGGAAAAPSGFGLAAARSAAAAVIAAGHPDMTAAQVREMTDRVLALLLQVENPATRYRTRGGARRHTHKARR